MTKAKTFMYGDLEYVDCNLCGSSSFGVMYDFSVYKIVRCDNCGLIFVNPRLKKEVTRKLYENSYFKNHDFYSGKGGKLYGFFEYEESRPSIEKMYNNILKKIEDFKKPGDLLEIGSAYGYFLNRAKQNGWRVSGIELSKEAAIHSQDHFGIEPFLGSFDQHPFAEKNFDVIVFFDVLEHLHDPTGALKTMNSMLREGGVIVFAVPNSAKWVFKLLGERWEDLQRAKSNEHLFFFQKATIKKILNNCDFELIKMKTMGRNFTLGQLSKRLQIYNKTFFSLTDQVIELLKMQEMNIYVNPGLKLIVYAKKIG